MASLDSSEAFLLYGHHAAPPAGRDSRGSLPTPLVRTIASPSMR